MPIIKKKETLFGFTKSGLYCIICTKNNKHYIGQSNNVKSRLTKHLNCLRRQKHENQQMQQDFNNYGEHCFQFENLVFGTNQVKQVRLQLEQLILLTLTKNKSYNIYINGPKKELNPFYGKKHTSEAKLLQSLAKIGHCSGFKGRTHTKQIKKRISKNNAGQSSSQRSKAVLIDGYYYKSISEASKQIGLNRRLIRERCQDSQRFKNYQWVNQ